MTLRLSDIGAISNCCIVIPVFVSSMVTCPRPAHYVSDNPRMGLATDDPNIVRKSDMLVWYNVRLCMTLTKQLYWPVLMGFVDK